MVGICHRGFDVMDRYFSEREEGPAPRIIDTIDSRVWGGLYALISVKQGDDSFGYRFPYQCPDGYGPCGHDSRLFELAAAAEIPTIEWPLTPESAPPTTAVMDLLEFCAKAVGEPVQGSWHSFFGHHHLSWDREAGLARFVQEVNRLFARNGVAFELSSDGQARRILPQPLHETLHGAVFQTGDLETDRLLEAARALVYKPDFQQRRDALEKLWDAFERIKTLEPGNDKRAQSEALLDRTAGSSMPGMRALLGEESKTLTDIGNRFRIRHAETSQEILSSSEQIDYLYQRMYAFIRLVLRSTKRGG